MLSRQNMTFIRGDDAHRLIEIKRQIDGKLQPVDLSDIARIDLHAKANGQIVLTRSTAEEAGIEFVNRTQGQVLLRFPHALTANWQWQLAHYDLQLTYQNGQVKTVLTGMIEVSADITRLEEK